MSEHSVDSLPSASEQSPYFTQAEFDSLLSIYHQIDLTSEGKLSVGELAAGWSQGKPALEKACAAWEVGRKENYIFNAPYAKLANLLIAVDPMKNDLREREQQVFDESLVMLEASVDDIGEVLEHRVETKPMLSLQELHALNALLVYSNNTEVQESALETLSSAKPAIEATLVDGVDAGPYYVDRVTSVLQLLEYGSQEDMIWAQALLSNILMSPSGKWLVSLINSRKDQSKSILVQYEPTFMRYIENTLSSYDLDANKLTHRWKIDPETNGPSESEILAMRVNEIPETMQTLVELASIRPEAAAVLQREFGLNNFHIYPIDMLVRQYDERNMSGAYGFVLTPAMDLGSWARANMKALQQLQQQEGEDFLLRFIEMEHALGEGGLEERLHELNERYSDQDGGSIQFGIFLLHSTERGGNMRIGIDYDYENYVHPGDIKTMQTTLRKVFVSEPDIILGSCWGNMWLRPEFEESLGARVHAVDDEVGKITSITIIEENGRKRLIPSFRVNTHSI